MTPFRMRLVVVAFLAIAAAITANAIYLQDAPRLVARSAGAPALKAAGLGAAQAAAHTPASVTASLPAKSSAPENKSAAPVKAELPPSHTQIDPPTAKLAAKTADPTPLVRLIQKKLAHFGYKAIPQNGVPSPETRAAILAVEYEQGRPLTGEPAEPILATLYFLEASGKTKLNSSDSFERDQKLVQEVQELLAKLGYTSGPIDGQLDAKTRDAIKRFETDRRLKGAGRLTDRVLLEMMIERGKPFLSKS